MKLGAVCESISRTFHRQREQVILINTSDVLDGKVTNHKYVQNENLRGQFKKSFQRDDILYSEIRPRNRRFAYVDFNANDYIASTKLMVIRANGKVLPQFLFQVLKSDEIIEQLQMLAETRSGTFPQITFSELASLNVRIPPILEQQEIAATLAAIEYKIENNLKINHHLEQMAQAIFKSWFVDFEPWDGVMPDEWTTGSLLDIADYLNGLAMQRFRPADGEIGLPVLKIKELRQGVCDSSSEFCSPSIRSDYIVHDGDVIFSWSGSLLVDFWCGGDCGLNQHLFKVTSTRYDKWFYYAWTCHHLDQFVAMAADKATTMGHIKRGALKNAEVIIPDNEDYYELGSLLAPLYEQLITNRVESRKLALLRDTLLPRLMSGELSITNLDNPQ